MADIAAPISANEIEQYKGDPALGYSGANAVEYGSNPQIQNPLQGLDSTLARMEQEDAQMRFQKHLENRQDLENIHKTLRGVDGSVFNMKGSNGKDLSFTPLPDDKKILDEKANKLRKYIIDHPASYQHDNKYLQMQADLDAHSHVAGQRAVFHADQNQMAMQSQDPDERAGYMQNIQKELKTPLTNLQTPNPYMPKPKLANDIDVSKYVDPKNREQLGTAIETRTLPDGTKADYEVTTSSIPKNVILKPLTDFSSEMTTQTKNWVNAFNTDPYNSDPARISAINKKINDNAQLLGVQPYYPAFIDPNTGKVVPNPNQREAYTGLRIEAYGKPVKSEKVSDYKSKQIAAEEEVKYKNAQIAKIYKDMEDAKERLRLAKNKDDREGADAAEKDYVSSSAVAKILKTTNDVRDKKDFTSVDDFKTNSAIKGILKNNLENNGLNPKDYEITHLSTNDATIQNLSGEQAQKANGEPEKGVNKPKDAFYIKSKTGNINDDRYVMVFDKYVPKLNPDGTEHISPETKKPVIVKETQYKLVSPKEAVGHTIKGEKNYDGITDKTIEAIGSGEYRWNEVSGGEQQKASPAQAKKADKAVIPDKVKKIANGSNPTIISTKDGTFYKVNGKYYNNSGEEIKE